MELGSSFLEKRNNVPKKITEYLEIKNVSQKDFEFLDGFIKHDTSLYFDPLLIQSYAIGKEEDHISVQMRDRLVSFFAQLLNNINDDATVRALLDTGSEMNENGLGMTLKGVSMGRGSSPDKLYDMFLHEGVLEHMREGTIRDYREIPIFTDGFGKDKLSDLITNICYDLLVEFTHQEVECLKEKHSIEVPLAEFKHRAWNEATHRWEDRIDLLPLFENTTRFFVPKRLLLSELTLDVETYFRKVVVGFYKTSDQTVKEVEKTLLRDGYNKVSCNIEFRSTRHKNQDVQELESAYFDGSYKGYLNDDQLEEIVEKSRQKILESREVELQ